MEKKKCVHTTENRKNSKWKSVWTHFSFSCAEFLRCKEFSLFVYMLAYMFRLYECLISTYFTVNLPVIESHGHIRILWIYSKFRSRTRVVLREHIYTEKMPCSSSRKGQKLSGFIKSFWILNASRNFLTFCKRIYRHSIFWVYELNELNETSIHI